VINPIRRRDSMDPTNTMLPVVNRLMNQFFDDPLSGEFPTGLATLEEGILPLDISENAGHIIVRASLPGFNPEDVDIQVENGILTIKAVHNEEHEVKDERFFRRERIRGSVSRRIALPSNVRGDAVEANLENGVLVLQVPKSEEAKPKRVQIKGAKTQTTPAGNGQHRN